MAVLNMGQSPSSEDVSDFAEGALPFLQGNAEFGVQHPQPKHACEEPRKVARKNDLMISVRAPVGALNVADRDYGIGRGLCAITWQKCSRRFGWWAMHHCREQLNTVATGSTYEAVSAEDVGNIRVPALGFGVQEGIAAYLDNETARIDELITEKEKMLKLLEEKRTALVSRVMTQGIDPNVKMRPSGVEWLGDIPAHWEVRRIGFLAKVGNGSTPERDNPEYWTETGYPWLNSSVVNDPVVTEPSDFVTALALRECHLPKVSPGSILVAITGEGKTRGKATLLSFEATINQHMAYIAPCIDLAMPEFLRYALTAAYAVLRLISEGMGSTKGALTCEQLRQFRVPLPPMEEQLAISKHLDAQLEETRVLVEALKSSLLLLSERRAALISAALTGQIKVAGTLTYPESSQRDDLPLAAEGHSAYGRKHRRERISRGARAKTI